jgi:hypothetical protein
MKKSKKPERKAYSKPDLDIKIPANAEFIVTPTPRKMINRREVQAKIDIDKQIRSMLASGHYNDNQIASLVRGANLERVKQIKNG